MAEIAKEESEREHNTARPKLDLWQDAKDGLKFICFNPRGNAIVMPILLLLESIALKAITSLVPYTEIDYKAYMEQVEMITIDKELDYTQIFGGTGPLVYPAGHVLLYRLMYKITHGMEMLSEGQIIFRYLYMATLILQMIIYYQLQLPPWCVVLACLSKRLHSIYVLRLFNDCSTTFFMVLTVLLLMQGCKKRGAVMSLLASIVYSVAVSIKMNALLFLPAFVVSVFLINQGHLVITLGCLITAFIWQLLVALPFLRAYPKQYFEGAFNFSRHFLYKWSVNWQFVGEEGFDSAVFHKALLASQVVGIMCIILVKYPNLIGDGLKALRRPLSRVVKTSNHAEVVPFILVTTNFVGVLFSRSLHYQFLAWYHWTIPILVHYSQLPWFLGPVWFILHEYCWNSYPPNAKASGILFALNAVMLLLISVSNLSNRSDQSCRVKKDQ